MSLGPPEAPKDLGELINQLNNPKASARRRAADAAQEMFEGGELGAEEQRKLVDALLARLPQEKESPSEGCATDILWALRYSRDPAIIDPLLAFIAHSPKGEQAEKWGMGELESSNHPRHQLRGGAVKALAAIEGEEEDYKHLVEGLRDLFLSALQKKDLHVSAKESILDAAYQTLVRLRNPKAGPALYQIAQSRRGAISKLAKGARIALEDIKSQSS